ncbi:MAG: hypothetical protein KatS3mg001_082 [Candidatus Pacearchaeota archaeon]|nr:MAG: hypothetical protein KatS3mg001_082 [Candidatus Pacearchaeota archaeon]
MKRENTIKNFVKKREKEEKVLIFDSGALISLSMAGLLDILKDIKKIFNGKFLVTREVKNEILDEPIKNKKFELEALRMKNLFDLKVLELPSVLNLNEKEISEYAIEIMELANTSFKGDNKDIHLLDIGECSCLALSNILTKNGIKNLLVIDERTTRMLVESHENLRFFLERKLHVKITINHANVGFFKNFKVIRSTELIYVAYKKGLIDMKDGSLVLDALLYALKFKGASISFEEIEEIKRLEKL